MPLPPGPTYLGDGLYAVIQCGMIELRANDINSPTDVVYLEPNVFKQLLAFAERAGFIAEVK